MIQLPTRNTELFCFAPGQFRCTPQPHFSIIYGHRGMMLGPLEFLDFSPHWCPLHSLANTWKEHCTWELKQCLASEHHSPRNCGTPHRNLQKGSLWAWYWGSRCVSLCKKLIRDRSQHPKEQEDNLNHLHNTPFFEALYLINFAAMLKDRLTMRSQMRTTFPPRTDERNFWIYFSFLSRQCGPCGPVLSHQSHSTAGHPWAVETTTAPQFRS